uniref:insecticidal delta-endotoxin Cry8Ea1 family protein n=1 Tax=Bacillus cereus TaxID=1396 RepID=UPI0005CDF586
MDRKQNNRKKELNTHSTLWFPSEHKNEDSVDMLQNGVGRILNGKFSLGISPLPEAIKACMQMIQKSIQLRLTSDIEIKEMVPYLWTEKEKTQCFWKICLSYLESLIQVHVPKSVKSNMFEKLQCLENEINKYVEMLERWKLEPNKDEIQMKLKIKIGKMDCLFEDSMRVFSLEKYGLLLLIMYSQIANLHLLLLRMVSMNGEE